ncbi:cupin domain-containing protein [Corynebacterium senegalense]|uniref:cupin domain-containing protein n=1 Tax=Corynebacterium senegalense TaxID=2080750 RepID=UPI000E1FC921|nr:cupin domain-containing protein [Corynebacterium senegalense]
MSDVLRTDHGPAPFATDIEKATVDNEAFRDTLWTGKNLQLTVMSIPPGGEIGAEIHDGHDQFLRLEQGKLHAMIGTSETDLELDQIVEDDDAIFVPAGKWHNFVNEGEETAKLYSIYAPPEHKPGTYHETKADADADEQETDGV